MARVLADASETLEFMDFSLNRVDGYRRRLVHEWNQWQARRDERRAAGAFERWLRQLERHPPDVLIGANFASYGGVRHHIHAIQRHSARRVELAPPESLVKAVGLHRFQSIFREPFFAFNASKLGAVHSHVFPWFIDWCRHQQQVNGVRWVHTYHLMYYPEHADGVLEPWQEDINHWLLTEAPKADVRLSVSKWQQKELRDLHGIESDYLPNGVDVTLCDKGRADRFQRKQNLDRFILYVGRQDPVKNPSEFVELARRIPEEMFVMIGGGLSPDSLLASDASELPVNLRIIGGMSQVEVQDAIAACSTLVVTSKREGLPTLVLEAMVHESPIVVPDEQGCMEAVSAGAYGSIYHLGDLDDLRSKTLAAVHQARVERGARQRVLEEYDWNVIAPKLDQLYQATNPRHCRVEAGQ